VIRGLVRWWLRHQARGRLLTAECEIFNALHALRDAGLAPHALKSVENDLDKAAALCRDCRWAVTLEEAGDGKS
jgi:hypothetical protein